MHVLMNKVSPQMLVLGSSRAAHHYNPRIIGDSLGLEGFNGGFDGKGTTIGYGILSGVAQRKFPDVIICDLEPSFDILDDNGSTKGINNFAPYINNPVIKTLINDFDPNAKWKMKSNAYRLNSSLLRIIPSVLSQHDDCISGYKPSYGKLKPNDGLKKTQSDPNYERKISPLKEKYLRALIQDAKKNGCKLIFSISPVYGGKDISYYQQELAIISEYDLPVLNHLNEPSLINRWDLFSDDVHLNDEGATKYSKIIANEINKLIRQ